MRTLLIVTLLALLGVFSAQANNARSLRVEQRRQLQSASSAIVTLVTGTTDLTELCHTFYTLSRAKGDLNAPVIVFYDNNSQDLLDGQKSALASCTDRPVSYESLNFGTGFPDGFVPVIGQDYTYEQSQRFLISQIWSHPALAAYDTIMRVSDDTCLSYDSSTLPYLLDSSLVYHSQAVPRAYEIATRYTTDLYQTAYSFISNNSINPKNLGMWSTVVQTHDDLNSLPILNNGFEVVRLSFMQRADVASWLNAVTESAPYGLYTHKWGTKHERFMTVAIFAEENEVSTSLDGGLIQKDFISGRVHEKYCHPEESA